MLIKVVKHAFLKIAAYLLTGVLAETYIAMLFCVSFQISDNSVGVLHVVYIVHFPGKYKF